ncbi:PREDICTED: uncharacterized protein LOC109586815 [Amphimedon queenslandica]|uniref:SRCR domain-containing protein n=1 Tax=Amphimedon queenslandica TaxID=400682 RepID=A0A1X7TNL9_AMPQE|nr:PREDICTED: uncharacterized protein LOC109586815 [Amphimedon queenslandica]|eukprot:XP_019858589.1 PREDICTED: uncharacterized protein LOC109586815 [Amphimedon queenslandica]
MFLKILTVTSIFIYTVASDEGDQLWDVKLDPLQLYHHNESWITICYDGISINVAHVACRQKGFINATTFKISDSPVVSDCVITQVLCPSTSNYSIYGETNIMRCNISDPVPKKKTCRSAKIICNTKHTLVKTNPYKGQVHLVDSNTATPADGTVEVHFGNEWYHVCNNAAFTNTVADSICRQYGYTGHDTWATETPSVKSLKSINATEYTCTSETGSFECFTHCMIPSKYKIIGSCDEHVRLTCKFNITKKYLTSGSRSQCALDEDSHRDIIIIGVLSSLLFISLLALFIISLLFCCKKIKKMKHHGGRSRKIQSNKIVGDDFQLNDRKPLKDYYQSGYGSAD